MIINDLDDYYIVFDTKNRNIELDTLVKCCPFGIYIESYCHLFIDILSSCEVLIFYHHEVLIFYSIAQLVNLLTNKIQNKNPARKYAILADFTMF